MADRDDGYRGYGRLGGRHNEGRDQARGAYGGGGYYGRDRDTRGGLFGGDRDDDRSRYMGRDRDDDRFRLFGRDRDDDRYRDHWRDRDEDRGFFERAGDEIRSWFSDDDDRSRDDWRGQSRNQSRDYPQTYRGEDQARSSGYESRGARYGATSGYGAGSAQNQYGGGRGGYPQDDHYNEWRNEQLSSLDRDYDEYRRENRDKFHSEFSNWRGQRQQQRSSLKQVREHQEVVGSDGEPLGTVDKVTGDKIILTKNGPEAGGHHHSIPCSWIQSVDDKVTINKTAAQARDKWTDEDTRRALFETDEHRRDDGPHILDRSFSGTYDKR